jgi:hypothetical protein
MARELEQLAKCAHEEDVFLAPHGEKSKRWAAIGRKLRGMGIEATDEQFRNKLNVLINWQNVRVSFSFNFLMLLLKASKDPASAPKGIRDALVNGAEITIAAHLDALDTQKKLAEEKSERERAAAEKVCNMLFIFYQITYGLVENQRGSGGWQCNCCCIHDLQAVTFHTPLVLPSI